MQNPLLTGLCKISKKISKKFCFVAEKTLILSYMKNLLMEK